MNNQVRNFGEFMKNLRKERGLTLAELSKESGVSQPFLSQIENNKRRPSPEILKKLYDPLEYPYDLLLIKAGVIDNTSQLDDARLKLVNLERDLFLLEESLKRAEENGDIQRKEEILKSKSVFVTMHNELLSEIALLENSINLEENPERLDNEINLHTKMVLHDLESISPIELNLLLDSELEIMINGKVLTNDEKVKLLKVAETMFSEDVE